VDFRSSRPILLDMSRNKYHGLGVSEEKMTRSKKEKGISSNTMSRRLNPSVAKTGYGLYGAEFAGVSVGSLASPVGIPYESCLQPTGLHCTTPSHLPGTIRACGRRW
jgi:hypothetical protein